MKLCSIVIVWDDWDMAQHVIRNISPVVDGVIVVYSRMSNYGEAGESLESVLSGENIITQNFEPDLRISPRINETNKRNAGLDCARRHGFTHFICQDSDEFYIQEDFEREKQRFIDNPRLMGLVCATQVYFRHPTLTIGLDTTLVPFIHRMTPNLRHYFNSVYPFARDKGALRIDPTRSLNINSGVEWSSIICHHMSWVRQDYGKKVRNSTARANIERSQTLWDDIVTAKDGKMCKFYSKVLHTVPNYFQLPLYDELEIQNLQSVPSTGTEKRADA